MGLLDFVKRHKFKLILAGGAAGAVVIVNKILSDYERQWQTSSSRGFVHEARKREIHFENIINECNQLCQKLTPRIIGRLQKNLDDSKLIHELAATKDVKDIAVKIELWKTLKVKIITRLVSEIYCTCILVCSIRVQMSVIGGHIFANKNYDSSGGPSSASVADLTQMKVHQKYIELLTSIQEQRFDCLIQPVEEAVDEAMKAYTIDYEISIQDFKVIVEKITQSMSFLLSCSESKNQVLFNSENISELDLKSTKYGISLTSTEEATLRNMLSETQDILGGDDFKKVLESSIEVGFALLLDNLLEAFIKMESQTSNKSFKDGKDAFSNPNSIKVRLARILPQIRNNLIIKKENDQKALVNHLLCLDVLNCFAANVYEAFCTPS